ncbi:hypothetical protein EJ02DRAFT_437301 [Clathrospora elynae]|uniref:Uncharacterized protein n=1 Tax=Clathrospora elynae TaxID=706981 RepID=A0A6A5SEM7_9PLEO|nr:hypothetical protein EJ02DRAFT_437301 [Clathrospora elynae]
MLIGNNTYHANITSTTKEGTEIYNALRGVFFARIGRGPNIIVWHPTRYKKVSLKYTDLKEGMEYRIETTLEGRQQCPDVEASGGYNHTQRHLKAIQGHWKLGNANEILPEDLAPRDCGALVYARIQRAEEPWWVTSGDFKAAVKNIAVGTGDQTYAEQPKEKTDTELFAGRLAAAVMLALAETIAEVANVGSAYEQDGRFTINTHFRKST